VLCDAPEGVLTDELLAALRHHKADLLALLRPAPVSPAETDVAAVPVASDAGPAPVETEASSPRGQVGRHGMPCPQCGDTWQWPTTSGVWVCSWCVCGNATTAPRFDKDGHLLSASKTERY
jgi:hypothetical protein